MAHAIGSVRPRLKADVFFVPLADGPGAYCLNGGDVLTLKGASTYAWLERLTPHLDGRHSVDELTGNLPPARRQMVETLVNALHEANLVRDIGADEPHSLTDAELASYASEIAFVECFRDSPGRRFESYRDTRTLVVGSGPVAAAMVRAATDTGVRAVTAVATGDRPSRAQLSALVEGFDLVVHVADGNAWKRAMALDRACAERRIRCVQAVIVGDEAWIGPVTDPDRGEIRWEHLWRRLRLDPARSPATPFLTGPVPAIIATHAVFAAFEHVTGVAEADAPATATRLCLESLATEKHLVPAHPLTTAVAAPDEADFRARLAALEAGEPQAAIPDGAAAGAVTGDRVGVVGAVDTRHFDQFPLRVATAAVTDPLGLLGDRASPVAVAAGWDHAEVRDAAERRAIELYCSLMVDRRRLVDADGRPSPPSTQPRDAHTFGLSLVDSSVRTVPATLAFPALAPTGADYRLPVGTAAAATWSDAVDDALLAHCRARSIAGATRADGAAFAPIELATVALDKPASRYLELLDLTGLSVTAHDVTTLPAVAAVVLRMESGGTWHGVGLTLAEAVEDALALVLLSYQARFADDRLADPELVAVVRAPSTVDRTERRRVLLAALRATGAVPVVLPLDHDPAVHAVLPYVARVVLLDD